MEKFFVIFFEDGTTDKVKTKEEAIESILNVHSYGIGIESVALEYEDEQLVERYGCSWSVSLEPLE